MAVIDCANRSALVCGPAIFAGQLVTSFSSLMPCAIAGTSMGAICGAAYASGLSGKEIHETTVETMRDRRRLMGLLMEARAGRLVDANGGDPALHYLARGDCRGACTRCLEFVE